MDFRRTPGVVKRLYTMAFLCGVSRAFRSDVGEYRRGWWHWENERLDAENRLWLIRIIDILLRGFVFSKLLNLSE